MIDADTERFTEAIETAPEIVDIEIDRDLNGG